MFKKILLPTDGSKNAERAGAQAIELANLSNADIVVLYVVETNLIESPRLVNYRVSLFDELREEGKKVVEDFKERLEESQCNGVCKNANLISMVKEGRPYDVILETINKENIDLTVMGASGRHGLDRLLLGSVTERVVRESKSPVLVVP
jgi:nucleotide-binding universal stress UspA family protein